MENLMNMFTTYTTSPIKLLGIGGSTRPGSRNSAALAWMMKQARVFGAEVETIDLGSFHLPLLDASRSLVEYPDEVAKLLEAVSNADCFILNTPTYHGGMSGAFKNALDFLFYGPDDYLCGKPVGLMALGGANGAPVLDMLTTTCHSLKGLVVPSRVLIPHACIGSDGCITDDSVISRMDRMLYEVMDYAAALHLQKISLDRTPLARVS
jgi:FMN reductase